MQPAKIIHQAKLNASGFFTRIPPTPTTYTPLPSTGNFLQSGVCEFEDGGSVTILTFAILDQACNRGCFRISARRSGGQCLETHAIRVAVLGLDSLAGRDIFCFSPDCLHI